MKILMNWRVIFIAMRGGRRGKQFMVDGLPREEILRCAQDDKGGAGDRNPASNAGLNIFRAPHSKYGG